MTYSMRFTVVSAAVVALGLGGCGGSQTTPPNAIRNNEPASLAQPSSSRPHTAPKPTDTAAQAVNPSIPQIPDDARFTILCREYNGPGHVQQAKFAKDELVRLSGKGDWHIISNDEQGSQLFFGYYRARDSADDPVEAKRIAADLEWIKSLQNDAGGRAFPQVAVVPLPVADPEAPAEYDITKVDADKPIDDPTRAYWTIAIAAYTADARGIGPNAGKSRKQLAVDAVIEARERYGIPAYFHHGENISTICIGTWPRSAVKEQEANEAKSRGDIGEELVVAAGPLGDELTRRLQNSGRDIKIVQPKIEIIDPTLLETWKSFPEYAVNDYVQVSYVTDPKTGKRTERRQPSFLVEIPRVQPKLLQRGPSQEPVMPPSLLTPAPGGNVGGRLRSVDR